MGKIFIAQERYGFNTVLIFPMITSATSNTAEVLNGNFTPLYCAYRAGRAYVCGEEECFEEMEENGKLLVKENPKYVEELIEKFKEKQQKLIDFNKTVFNSDLTQKTDEELLNIYKNYYKYYYEAFPYGEPITWATRFTLVDELKEKLKDIVSKEKINETVATLISPDEPSFVNNEEITLLKIVKEIQNDETKKELFLKGELEIVDEHTKDYCWVPYDNGSIIWDKKHFENAIKENLNKDVDLKITKMQNYSVEIKKKKQILLNELNLDEHTKKMFEAVATSGYMQDLKKELASYAHYLFTPWLNEISRRFNLTQKQVSYLTLEDVEKLLTTNKVNKEELDERDKLSVFCSVNGKNEVWTGQKAIDFFKTIDSLSSEKQSEIEGTCANPGSVTGIAHILLNPNEIKDMKDGEILITTMTTPDYVPAMKKTKGIVTEEGGLTCHAAVVSRELGIPCIVGAKNVTKFLKTGDLVEIHGATGIVRKLGGTK